MEATTSASRGTEIGDVGLTCTICGKAFAENDEDPFDITPMRLWESTKVGKTREDLSDIYFLNLSNVTEENEAWIRRLWGIGAGLLNSCEKCKPRVTLEAWTEERAREACGKYLRAHGFSADSAIVKSILRRGPGGWPFPPLQTAEWTKDGRPRLTVVDHAIC